MGVSDKKKTFKKNIGCDQKLNERMKMAMQKSTSSLGIGGLENTVKLPRRYFKFHNDDDYWNIMMVKIAGEKKNEWLGK